MVLRPRGRGRVGHRRHPFDTAPLLATGPYRRLGTSPPNSRSRSASRPDRTSTLGGASLANRSPMTLSKSAIASASATAAAAAVVLLRREQLTRAATERFAAAA